MEIPCHSGSAGTKKPALQGGLFFGFILPLLVWAILGTQPVWSIPPVVFASYNVENYALIESERTRIKTPEARDAVADVASEVHPDLLGLCEIGSPEALEDLRARLQQRGVRLPYAEFVDGPDTDRHLALLSRFPFVSRQSRTRVPFELNGTPEVVRRGFLDVTIQIHPTYTLRVVGVHLKSKLPSPAGETLVRRMEALALRSLVDEIIAANPQMNLLVYGDFNETKEEAAIRGVLGARGGLNSLTDLPAEDSRGDRWTHYRFFTDVYSRIDYLMINRALRPEIVPGSARISQSSQWRKASDHRMIYTEILPVDR
jgi:endonuclease/exonuclease/phosphatase family metal-dependent hydrolase